MIGRKLFLLASGYVAGNVVNSLYNSKKKRALDLQKKEDVKDMVGSFVDTHKNMLSDMENKYVSEKHKGAFQKKKNELLTIARDYYDKGKAVLKDVTEDLSDDEIRQQAQQAKDSLMQAKRHGKEIAEDIEHKAKKHI